MGYNDRDNNENITDIDNNTPKEKIGFKDILAIAIAQFSILMPIFLIAAFIFFLLLLFITKIWLRG